jgi:hypothetical protein
MFKPGVGFQFIACFGYPDMDCSVNVASSE